MVENKKGRTLFIVSSLMNGEERDTQGIWERDLKNQSIEPGIINYIETTRERDVKTQSTEPEIINDIETIGERDVKRGQKAVICDTSSGLVHHRASYRPKIKPMFLRPHPWTILCKDYNVRCSICPTWLKFSKDSSVCIPWGSYFNTLACHGPT